MEVEEGKIELDHLVQMEDLVEAEHLIHLQGATEL